MARVKRYKLDESPFCATVTCPNEYELRFYFSTATGHRRFKDQIDAYTEQVSGVLARRYRGLTLDGTMIAAFDLYAKIERGEQYVVMKYFYGPKRVLDRGSLIKMDCLYKGPYGGEG